MDAGQPVTATSGWPAPARAGLRLLTPPIPAGFGQVSG